MSEHLRQAQNDKPNATDEATIRAAHRRGARAGHSHAPASFSTAFAIGTALNLTFVLIEALYG